jgi:hypothetical protein
MSPAAEAGASAQIHSLPPLLAYGDRSACDSDPTDDVAEFGGRPCDPDAFDRWITEPGNVAFVAISFTLLLVALVMMHRALTRPRMR